jgi:hypothetical protein
MVGVDAEYFLVLAGRRQSLSIHGGYPARKQDVEVVQTSCGVDTEHFLVLAAFT